MIDVPLVPEPPLMMPPMIDATTDAAIDASDDCVAIGASDVEMIEVPPMIELPLMPPMIELQRKLSEQLCLSEPGIGAATMPVLLPRSLQGVRCHRWSISESASSPSCKHR